MAETRKTEKVDERLSKRRGVWEVYNDIREHFNFRCGTIMNHDSDVVILFPSRRYPEASVMREYLRKAGFRVGSLTQNTASKWVVKVFNPKKKPLPINLGELPTDIYRYNK